MAKISGMKRAVEADPAAALQTSLDASMAKARSRLLRILLWTALAAAAASIAMLRATVVGQFSNLTHYLVLEST
jgi:hypothetical protein